MCVYECVREFECDGVCVCVEVEVGTGRNQLARRELGDSSHSTDLLLI